VSTRTRRPQSARRAEQRRPQRARRAQRSSDDVERYKRAAEAAIEQLDVCIDYLRRLQRRQLASRLARNRAMIVRRWMR
jgi:hypothetical protein